MIKVILISMSGRKIDLFPENFTFREVFKELQVDYACKAVRVDGEQIQEEELGNSLQEYCRGSVMHIAVCTMLEKVEEPDPHVVETPSVEDEFRNVYNEMTETRDKLNGIINKLESFHPEWAMPF